MPTTSSSWRRSRAAERPRDVEQVVAADADDELAGRRGVQAAGEQRLVAGVDVALGGVRRRLPAAELGVDVLHRQVGALDEAHLDVPTAALVAGRGPGHDAVEHGVGVRQVGLQHDARREALEARLVEHPAERLDGQVEIAVLLHVEVDEDRRVALEGDAVHRPQALGDAFDLVVERQHVEVGTQRGGLDRDVRDVGSAHPGAQRVQTALRLVVADDRLAEQVDVDAEPSGAAGLDVPGERGVTGGDDDAARLGADATADDGRHRSWGDGGSDSSETHGEAIRRAAGRAAGRRPPTPGAGPSTGSRRACAAPRR